MDYESRKVKWYWLCVYMLYCVGVVYLLFQGNPFLYSHQDLRGSMTAGESLKMLTIPTNPDTSLKLSQATGVSRYNTRRTATDPIALPRSKNYEEFERYPVNFGGNDFTVEQVAQDASGLYLTGQSTWVIALGLDGQPRWRYRFKDAPAETSGGLAIAGVPTVLLDENTAYLIHPKGAIVALNKISGEIRWVTSISQDVMAPPILWKNDILVPSKSPEGLQMVLVHRSDGKHNPDAPHLEIKPGFMLTEAPALELLIATIDNKVIAISPTDWTIDWTQTLTDPIKGPAVVVDSQIYVATLGARIVKLDGTKKGKVDWEADLEKPAASAPAYIPVIHRLTVMDSSGALSAVDAKTGKVSWRMAVENRNPLHETWTARLSAKYIEEFKMDWLHKGWSIWTACGESHFCMFTPNKGQLIGRVQLSGHPLFLPLPVEKRWIFLTESKPGHYILSHAVEEAEVKRLKSATNSTSPTK